MLVNIFNEISHCIEYVDAAKFQLSFARVFIHATANI